MHLNVEIKARSKQNDRIRSILQSKNADYRGVDHQVDTYFHNDNGRLKLRRGNIEHNLIFYRRPDQAGPKTSEVFLYQPNPGPELYELLKAAYGIWREVKKAREIYFIDNVKFHLDEVEGLGSFVEIEAIDFEGSLGKPYLQKQCDAYISLLEIKEVDLIEESYSDLIGRM